MSQWEVFRPTNGPLMVRDSIDHGSQPPSRPRTSSSGPQWSSDQYKRLPTAGSSSWIFTRHNPHPRRVRHFKGLNDIPICSVFDEGYESAESPVGMEQEPPITANSLPNRSDFASGLYTRHNPHPNRVKHLMGLWNAPICNVNDEGYGNSVRQALPFPPDTYNQAKLRYYGRYKPRFRSIPGNALNVNAPGLPIDTLTGLLKYTDKRQFQMLDDIRRLPLGPPTWREEVRAMIDALGLTRGQQNDPSGQMIQPPRSPPTGDYNTRLGSSSSRPITGQLPRAEETSDDEKAELVMLQLLCQLLKTSDVRSAQDWLVTAADREKALVVDMLRTSLSLYADLANQDSTNNSNGYAANSCTDPSRQENIPQRTNFLPRFNGLQRAATSIDAFKPQPAFKATNKSLDQPRLQSANGCNKQASSPTALASAPPKHSVKISTQGPMTVSYVPPSSPVAKRPESVSLRYTKAPITKNEILEKVAAATK